MRGLLTGTGHARLLKNSGYLKMAVNAIKRFTFLTLCAVLVEDLYVAHRWLFV